jgi:hypothetical protein
MYRPGCIQTATQNQTYGHGHYSQVANREFQSYALPFKIIKDLPSNRY